MTDAFEVCLKLRRHRREVKSVTCGLILCCERLKNRIRNSNALEVERVIISDIISLLYRSIFCEHFKPC